MITGRIEGSKYAIVFYGCKNGKNCDDIQFTAAWGGVSVDAENINTYNRKKRYGRAFLDKDGDPRLDMTVNTDYGVTLQNLADSFDWWVKAVKSFKKDVLNNS